MSRTLLAIESSTDWLSVALLRDEEVIALREHEGSRQHASALLTELDKVLAGVGLALDDVDAIGVSCGPGSFTSVRIGLATVKGLAFGRDLPAIGVSTLEAMALSVLEGIAGAGDHEVVALLDARRGEWYAGSWSQPDGAGALATMIVPEGLYAPVQLAADLAPGAIAMSPEPAGWRAAFEQAGLRFSQVIEAGAARPRADWVGRLAQRRLDRGERSEVRELSARYLRRAEAEAKRLGGPVEAGGVARVGDESS